MIIKYLTKDNIYQNSKKRERSERDTTQPRKKQKINNWLRNEKQRKREMHWIHTDSKPKENI